MRALLATTLLLVACDPGEISVDPIDRDAPRPSDSGTATDSDTDSETSDSTPPDRETGLDDTGADTQDATAIYDDAQLVIREPQSARVYLLANGLPLDGEIRSAQGDVLPFRDIAWSVRGATTSPFVGKQAVVPDVPAGSYTIDVQADLPNGDRLRQTLSEVRMQHRFTGTWSGTARIVTTSSFQGTPVTSNCIGGVYGTVDPTGEIMQGEGACTVSLGGLGSFDIDLRFEGDIADPDVSGEIVAGTGLLANTLSWSGRIQGGAANRTVQGAFQGTVGQMTLDGTLTARQINTWSSP